MNLLKSKKLIFALVLAIAFISAGVIYSINKAQEKKIILHFAHISDVHLQNPSVPLMTGKLLPDSQLLLTTALGQTNQISDLDFVISTGDLVNVPSEELVDKYIQLTMASTYPVYSLLGNHDVNFSSLLKKADFIEKFYTLPNATSFTDMLGYYTFSPNDKFLIICLDGTIEELDTANGKVDSDQIQWAQQQIEQNPDKYILIAIHFPLIPPYHSPSRDVLEPGRTQLLNLIKNSKNVIGVLAGHYHAAGLYQVDGKVYDDCPALVQYPNAFREIIITQETPKTLKIDCIWHEVNAPALVALSKKLTRPWKLFGGTKKDQEQIFEVTVSD